MLDENKLIEWLARGTVSGVVGWILRRFLGLGLPVLPAPAAYHKKLFAERRTYERRCSPPLVLNGMVYLGVVNGTQLWTVDRRRGERRRLAA
jgi:hypothetical protein